MDWAPQVRQSLGAGNWRSRRDAVGRRDWQVQLKRFDDDSLTGRLTVVGSARIRQAKIVGQISGSDVYGVIVNDNGRQLGTFTGTIAPGGMSGTYTTADGDVGDWKSRELAD